MSVVIFESERRFGWNDLYIPPRMRFVFFCGVRSKFEEDDRNNVQ